MEVLETHVRFGSIKPFAKNALSLLKLVSTSIGGINKVKSIAVAFQAIYGEC